MPDEPQKPKDLNPHDDLTAALHAAAKEQGVTPAWLAQQPEWAEKIKAAQEAK